MLPSDAPLPRDDVRFSVIATRRRTPVVDEITARPVGDGIDYRPGQYVLVGDIDGGLLVRSYSVANAPCPDGVVTLLVTRVPGGALSRWLHGVREGDELVLSGPYGTFVDDLEISDPRLYLAGGSGLAPVRALIEAGLAHPRPPAMTLLFSARTASDLIDDEVFRQWEVDQPGFRYLRTLTRAEGPPPVGHVPAVLADLVPALDRHRVYIAGGSSFVAACVDAVRRHGGVPGRVFTEEFFVDP